jgi:hypothetical protein
VSSVDHEVGDSPLAIPQQGEEYVVEVTGLVSACAIAMVAVFFLLGVLALVMELITLAFPVRRIAADPAIIAAVTTTVTALFPGSKVTRIEEEP